MASSLTFSINGAQEKNLKRSIRDPAFSELVTTPYGQSCCKRFMDSNTERDDGTWPESKQLATQAPSAGVTRSDGKKEPEKMREDEYAGAPSKVACDFEKEPEKREDKYAGASVKVACNVEEEPEKREDEYAAAPGEVACNVEKEPEKREDEYAEASGEVACNVEKEPEKREDKYNGAPGEVACDVEKEPEKREDEYAGAPGKMACDIEIEPEKREDEYAEGSGEVACDVEKEPEKREDEYAGASGEVACDIEIEPEKREDKYAEGSGEVACDVEKEPEKREDEYAGASGEVACNVEKEPEKREDEYAGAPGEMACDVEKEPEKREDEYAGAPGKMACDVEIEPEKREDEYAGAPGEVACDVEKEPEKREDEYAGTSGEVACNVEKEPEKQEDEYAGAPGEVACDVEIEPEKMLEDEYAGAPGKVACDVEKEPEKMREDEYAGAPGEVACDVCPGRKVKAKKSCLMCLASYCSAHLENHYSTERLKGHKLVEPVRNLDERACLSHGRPLELYNREWHRCICVRCIEEGVVVPTEDEWNRKKVELDDTKAELMQKIKNREMKVDEINTSLKSCLDQLDSELQETEDVFAAAIATVEEAMRSACQPLKDRRQVVLREAKEVTDELQADISELEKTVSKLDDLSALEDHILFLQSYPSLPYRDSKDLTEVALDTSLSFGSMRKTTATMMDQLHQQLEELASTGMASLLTFSTKCAQEKNLKRSIPDAAFSELVTTPYGQSCCKRFMDSNTERNDGTWPESKQLATQAPSAGVTQSDVEKEPEKMREDEYAGATSKVDWDSEEEPEKLGEDEYAEALGEVAWDSKEEPEKLEEDEYAEAPGEVALDSEEEPKKMGEDEYSGAPGEVACDVEKETEKREDEYAEAPGEVARDSEKEPEKREDEYAGAPGKVACDVEKEPEKMREDEYAGAPGEVACDVCPGRKVKAKKSCLMCLTSYCSAHLENHYSTERLKGHKLVEPVRNLDERACLSHGRPLELYNREWHRCICIRCIEEGVVVPAEDEWNRKKVELDDTKAELMQKIKNREMKVDEINTSLKSCLDQLDSELQETENVFVAAIATVEEAMRGACQPLKDRRQVVLREAKEVTDELQADISELEKTVSELDNLSALEDHILFLQSYPSLPYPDSKDWTEVALDTSLSFGSMRKITATMMDQLHQQLEELASTELKRVAKFKVDVKLDPSTSHPHLVLSEDGKEVRDGGQIQEVPDAPERFNLFASILGGNSLVSGRSYWEVKVGNKMGWDLGVARGNANRRGKLSLNPDLGYWVLVHYDDKEYAATAEPPVHLSVKEKPQRVGVFVDHDEGLVSFYDVAAQSHIYSFTGCSFNGEILPYFSPHLSEGGKNSTPLIIC